MSSPVVVFDLGKVLLDFDYGRTVRRIAGQSRLPARDILAAIDQSHLLHAFETGKLGRDEFRAEVTRLIGFEGDAATFENAFADIFTDIPPMIAWQARLRAQGVKTFIFSNTNEIAVDHIRTSHSFFSGFDGYVYSYEHGAMKPDSRIYEALEAASGEDAAQHFYIDDRIENVEAGLKRGWQAVLHTSAESTLAAARLAGLPG